MSWQHAVVVAGPTQLPTELDPHNAAPLVHVLVRATELLVTVAREHVAYLDAPSALPGWSRLMVLAHLRYVASAMRRMTVAALDGRSEPMYPGGRAKLRPRTIVPAPGESPEALLMSLENECAALDALWTNLSEEDWQRRIDDPDHGAIAVSRLLVLRLTEAEVHGSDLNLPGLDAWDDLFVDRVLPLRLAWLERARHHPDADVSLNGSWLISDGHACWRVVADGHNVRAHDADAKADADCGIAGSRRDLLAWILGRPTEEPIAHSGNLALANSFKRAFPGP